MAATALEPPPNRQESADRLATAINRVSPRKVNRLTVRKYLRRLVTLVLWPSIDIIVTLFSNYLILRFNPFVATAATILVMIVLNGALLYLLMLELDFSDWIRAKAERLQRIRNFVYASERRRDLMVLLVYTFSGPTMAGVPLIWLMGITGRRAYSLVVIGTTLNGIFWVGAIYSSIWAILGELFAFNLPF
ncbi:MAG: hypothetical protein OXE05_03615 [Chloroflexi bacterium]|nr:hypothetical protein [Chloroflexota bacterium]